MDKRQKASDVFRDTNFFVATKTSFENAFPEIEDIGVVVIESEGFVGDDKKRYYSKRDAGEYIDCSNSRCYNGGFCLGALIRKMLSSRETELVTTEYCQGYEGSPKGKKNYGPCDHTFEVTIKIKYKNAVES